ncbi:response regulator transcription factor [Puteibacter caeruleilacunae]|nr:response regulator transcription factor [Puteibacter caeruleilacunae]
MTAEKVKCVIVEDEQHNMRLLENYISNIKSLEIIGTFLSPVELLNFERLTEVELMYLDIQMPGMTGVELLKSVPMDVEVIFTTAYSEYALQGYELNVTDYLLKPIELARFVQATNKAVDNIRLKKMKSTGETMCKHVLLKVDKKLVRVQVEDIVYIQSDWNYVHVYTKDTRHIVLSTMKQIQELLREYDFVRIHKSFLINLDHFESIEGNVVQVRGIRLQVSRSYKNDLVDAIQ